MNSNHGPQRIVCLTGETAETLYLLGEEVKSSYILQPGPASLTVGLRQLHAVLASVVGCVPADGLQPSEPLDPDVALVSGAARDDAAREEIQA